MRHIFKGMEKIKNSKIGIVCHDAGGAEIISNWVYFNNSKNKFYYSLKGPSLKIFKKNKIFFKNLNLRELIKKIDILFAGTSLKSYHEIEAIREAKKKGVKIYSFLDHWINYKERFLRRKKFFFPNIIVVSDKYSFNIANKIFDCPVVKEKNFYFERVKKMSKKKNDNKKTNLKILYLSSNNDLNIKKNYTKDRIILSKTIKFFSLNKRKIQFNIRKHPSENYKKYFFIKRKEMSKIKIYFDKNKKLTESILKSDIVVGYDSMGLVIAHLLNRKTYNIKLPNKNEKNVIPKIFFSSYLKI